MKPTTKTASPDLKPVSNTCTTYNECQKLSSKKYDLKTGTLEIANSTIT